MIKEVASAVPSEVHSDNREFALDFAELSSSGVMLRSNEFHDVEKLHSRIAAATLFPGSTDFLHDELDSKLKERVLPALQALLEAGKELESPEAHDVYEQATQLAREVVAEVTESLELFEIHYKAKTLKLSMVDQIRNADHLPAEVRADLEKDLNQNIAREKAELEKEIFGGLSYPEVSNELAAKGTALLYEKIVELNVVLQEKIRLPVVPSGIS